MVEKEMICKKTKSQKILDAITALNKAMKMEEPHLRINLPGGFYDTEESEEFAKAVKIFIRAYKKFYGLKKINVEIIL